MSFGSNRSRSSSQPWKEQQPYLLKLFEEAARLYDQGPRDLYEGEEGLGQMLFSSALQGFQGGGYSPAPRYGLQDGQVVALPRQTSTTQSPMQQMQASLAQPQTTESPLARLATGQHQQQRRMPDVHEGSEGDGWGFPSREQGMEPLLTGPTTFHGLLPDISRVELNPAIFGGGDDGDDAYGGDWGGDDGGDFEGFEPDPGEDEGDIF